MERYIGLDAHASSCTLGIVGPSGKRLGSQVVETNARALIEVLRGIPRNRHLCLEEGTLSGWLYEVLEPHVEELTVAGVGKSRGPKTDKLDAFALAEKLRIGSLETRVYKNRGQFRRLGERAKSYDFLVGDTVRVKNRLKSVLRSRGVAYGAGRSVYLKRDREEWLAKLPEASRATAGLLYEEHDALVALRAKAEKALLAEVRTVGQRMKALASPICRPYSTDVCQPQALVSLCAFPQWLRGKSILEELGSKGVQKERRRTFALRFKPASPGDSPGKGTSPHERGYRGTPGCVQQADVGDARGDG